MSTPSEESPTVKVYTASYNTSAVVGMLSGWFAVISYLAGIVLAKGFWETLCSLFPFYAWYLVVERLMHMFGLVAS